MESIKIGVVVPLHAALAQGRAQYGETEVALTAEHLAQLTPEARREIVPPRASEKEPGLRVARIRPEEPQVIDGYYSERLEVESATPEAVVAALLAHAAERVAAIAAAAAKSESEFLAALAAPAEAWLSYSGDFYVVDQQDRYARSGSTRYRQHVDSVPTSLTAAQKQDPRILARREAVLREIAPVLAKWERRYAEWKAWCAEDARHQQAEQERIGTLYRDYVIAHVPEFVRAAQDGCDVSRGARDAVRDEIVSALAAAGLATLEYYDTREQDLPCTFAYERLDTVREALQSFTNHPLIVQIDSSIQRADLAEDRDDRDWHTCVIISITCLGTPEPIGLAVDAEALPDESTNE